MRAYKWTTDNKEAFYDGFKFKFGWNEQDGPKDGAVCRSGGFHISKNSKDVRFAPNSKIQPHGDILCHCYEVYYRNKDILGQSAEKLRVKAFKILRKKPLCVSRLNFVFAYAATYYGTTSTSSYYRAADSTSTSASTTTFTTTC